MSKSTITDIWQDVCQKLPHPLTNEWEESRIVIRHDEEVDEVPTAAGLEVSKGMLDAFLLPTVTDEHLQRDQDSDHLIMSLGMDV